MSLAVFCVLVQKVKGGGTRNSVRNLSKFLENPDLLGALLASEAYFLKCDQKMLPIVSNSHETSVVRDQNHALALFYHISR